MRCSKLFPLYCVEKKTSPALSHGFFLPSGNAAERGQPQDDNDSEMINAAASQRAGKRSVVTEPGTGSQVGPGAPREVGGRQER